MDITAMARWVQDHPYRTVELALLLALVFIVNDVWHRIARWGLKRKIRALSTPSATPIAANPFNPFPQPRRRYSEWELMQLSPEQFEHLVADMFRKQGYTAEVTPPSKDGGKDVILRRDSQILYVECKRYKDTVGVDVVRAAHSVMHTDRVDGGFVVTARTISADAKNYGLRVQPRIYCIEGDRLVRLLNDEPGVSLYT